MQIKLGVNKYTKELVVWDSDKVVNRHFMIVGESGSGKTYMLKGLAHGFALSKEKTRCYVFDVHSDIDTNEAMTSMIEFGENSEYGLQPLSVDPDRNFGGVKNAINNFIRAFAEYNPSMGEIQHHALYNSLIGMYRDFGFYADDPLTWSTNYDIRENPKFPKRQPTVKDLIDYIKKKLAEIKYNIDANCYASLETISKSIRKIKRAEAKLEKAEIALEKAKAEAVEHFKNFIEEEWDIDKIKDSLNTPDENTLSKVIIRLENFYNTGIFKEKELDFDPNKPIQRFNIRSLDIETKKAFVQLMLNKIFTEEKAKGETGAMRCAIFLDEAKDYTAKKKDGLVERIALEGRKFGIVQVIAGQQLEQFHKETISQCATKIVLGVDSMYHSDTVNKLSISREMIENIVHQKNILISIKRKGENTGDFVEVQLPQQN